MNQTHHSSQKDSHRTENIRKDSINVRTNPVNVCRSRIREIIVYHAVDPFEIHTSSYHISCNQNPCLSRSETINRVFPLQTASNGLVIVSNHLIHLYFPLFDGLSRDDFTSPGGRSEWMTPTLMFSHFSTS